MTKRPLVLAGLLSIVVALANVATASTKLSLTMQSAGEMIISVDPALHQEFGLSYPVTYKLSIPGGSAGLVAYRKHLAGEAWTQLPEKTSGDYFNGEEVVRFDYAASSAYVSATFDAASDDIFLRITDGSGQPVTITFQNICRYYDNRQSVVTLTADDWKDYTNQAFIQTIHILRSYNLPVTTGIITSGCTSAGWQSIQSELDLGLVEAASHTRTHVEPPYPDPTGEIIGSKQDLLTNLRMPPAFRKGSQGYVYTWIAPYGWSQPDMEALVSQGRYIIDRGTFASNGEFSAWSETDRRYVMAGKTAEMGPFWGGMTDAPSLNALFDQTLSGGEIYHLMMHPIILADSNLWAKPDLRQHLAHISNRTNVWYVNFGTLYVYHLLQDDAAGTVEIAGGPPVIATQPAPVNTTQGGTATFSVTARGGAPLSYQWQRNGADIPGAVSAVYTTPSLTQADSGALFRCVVSNSLGSVTSNDALLMIVPANVLTNGSFESGTTPWNFYSNGSASFSQASTGTSGTKSGRISISTEGTNVQLYQAYITLQPNTEYRLSFDAYSSSGHDLEVSIGKHVSPYVNYGLNSRVCDLGTGWQSFTMSFTTTGFSNTVGDARLMFWLAPYDAAGDVYSIDNVVLAPATDVVPVVVAPQITLQPVSQTVTAGQAATFSVAASGTAPLSYQWQKNAADIAGATGSSYRTAATTAADSGAAFRCIVSNSAGSVTSQAAVLVVNKTTPATSNAVTNGTFENGTTGWTFYTNGAGSYATAGPGSSGSGLAMQVSVTTEGTNVQLYQYGITLQPNTSYQLSFDAYSSTGHDVAVSVSRHVSPYTNYGLNGQVFNLTTGWQNFTVTFTTSGFSSTVSDARLWFWMAPYDASGDKFYFDNVQLAEAGDLTPLPPTITQDPISQSVMAGQTATFSVSASGAAPLLYQWQKDGSPISGATGATYTTPATTAADSGSTFQCVVTNAIGSATSQAAMLSVTSVVQNLLTNGSFENGTTGWYFYTNGVGSYTAVTPGYSGTGRALQMAITTEGTNVQLYQYGVSLQSNTSYQLSFNAYSSSGHDLDVSVGQHGSPYANYGLSNRLCNLTTSWQTYSVSFTTSGFSGSVNDARLMFWLASYDATGDRYYIDDVVLRTSPAKEAPGEEPLAPSLATTVPGDFVLEGNFPNPFNPSTVIRYGLPEPATVSIAVYSVLGQEVARLSEGYQSAGTFEVVWDGHGSSGVTLSSGIYLCRMAATGAGSRKAYVATKRMVLMK